ncbi:MAG: hypothetical protein IPN90_13840 [Elusimicrobia bacterium]|nr:hypothetical protein [Elusimicrobiota bacterium]
MTKAGDAVAVDEIGDQFPTSSAVHNTKSTSAELFGLTRDRRCYWTTRGSHSWR